MISVVIPAYNASATLGQCLASVYAAAGTQQDVVVVDDGSTDATAAVASRHPCRLVRRSHLGAAAARNAGAAAARGEILFFTDADCALEPDTLLRVAERFAALGPRAVLGGTYAVAPADPSFFSRFQAVFVHHAETLSPEAPDYVATHALAIAAADFRAAGGFDERLPLPILEDVELSHRLRRAGFRLVIDPAIQVRHHFGFGLAGSLRNAARKARHWTRYSIGNRDLLAASGTASRGLKAAGAAWLLSVLLLVAAGLARRPAPLAGVPALGFVALIANRGLIGEFRRSHGRGFAARATAYYLLVYPAAVWTGAAAGAADWLCVRRGRPAPP